MELLVDGFTISYSMDPGNGRRSNSFVSVNFKLSNPVPIKEMESIRLEASRKVTIWATQDAVLRGDMSSSDAKERIDILTHNYDGMAAKYTAKE